MERKGVLTPEQEQVLDRLVKFNSPVAEKLDGPAITLIDNQGLERLKNSMEEKYPGSTEEFIYPIVDALFEGLEAIAESTED